MTAPRSVGSVSVTVVPNATGWKGKLEAQLLPTAKALGEQFGKAMGDEIARQLGERTKDAPVGPSEPTTRERGSRSAGAFADAFKAKLKAAMESLPPIEIGVAASEAEQKLRDIRADLADLSGKKIGVDLTDDEALAKLDELRVRLAELNESAESVSVRADTGAALVQLDKLRANLDELAAGHRDVDIDVNVHDGQLDELPAKVAAVDAAAGSSGGGFNLFGSRIAAIGGIAVAAADVAIPAVLAIGAAAAGALAGIGVLGLGFSGIGAALTAHGKQTGGGSGAGAGLGLESARINATQATQSAQDQLTTAIQNQAKAEKGLHDARVQAVQDLQDLDNKLKDNTLSQVQAAINLDIARRTLAVTLNAPGASQAQYADQVAQARLNVGLAQQKVNELALAGSRLAPADALAHKQGITGNPGVVAAQQTLTDANRKLAEAQANIGITAQKNAIALQQAAISMASAAAGANQFANAMAKLNPLQRQFVDFLLQMKPLFDQLKTAASEFLPGLEQGIRNASKAFGPILAIVGNVAKALGTVFENIGASFASPSGQKFLTFLSVELPKQIVFLGNVFIGFGQLLGNIFEAAAPLIQAFDTAILGSLNGAVKLTAGVGLKSFFDSLIPSVRPVLSLLGAVGGLVRSLLVVLAPQLPALAKALIDVVKALSPLVPIIAELVRLAIPVLDFLAPLAPYILGVVIAAKLWTIAQAALNLVLDANPIGLIIIAIAALVAGIILAYNHSATFRDVVQSAFAVVKQVVSDVWTVVRPIFRAWVAENEFLGATVQRIFGAISGVVGAAMTAVITVFHNIAGPVKTAFSAVWDGVKTVWTGIEGFFKGIVNGVIDIINTLINLLDNLHIHIPKLHIPGTSVDFGGGDIGFNIPDIPHLAAGGPVRAGQMYQVGELGPELFVPRVDGSIINAADTTKWHKSAGNGRGGSNYFTVYGQSDPVATSHAVANRFAARAT